MTSNLTNSADTLRSSSDMMMTDDAFADPAMMERRSASRLAIRLNACLMPLSGADDIRCETVDLTPHGVHVSVPVGFGVAPGQRYQVELAAPGATLGMGPLLTPPGVCATVVHTRMQSGAAAGNVAVGMQFDQPIVV